MMDKLSAQGFSVVKRCLWAAGLSLGLGAGLPGCVAHAQGELVSEYPSQYVYPTEYVAEVPARIEYYPHTYYQGRPAYLVGERWYYHTRERWVVFREEPAHLREYRMHGAAGYAASRDRERVEQRRAEQRREEQRREEQRRAEQWHQQQHREQERHAQAHRDEQERRGDARRGEQDRHDEPRATEHGEADRRVAERRRATRQRDRDRADHESRPREHGQRDPRDDHRED
jgi:hypothetical protein